MVHAHASPYDDDFIASDFRAALAGALLDSLNNHLIAIALGLLPSILFIIRICIPLPTPHPHSYISYILTSRLSRVLLSICALIYFPVLALWTSIVCTIFTFLLRQTTAVERLLQALCASVTTPVVDRLLALSPGQSTSALALSDLRKELRQSATIVRKKEELVAKSGRRSLLKGLVRRLTDIGIAAGIAALAYVAETRFKDALALSSSATSSLSSPSVDPNNSIHHEDDSLSANVTAVATKLVAEVASAMGVGEEVIGNDNRSKRLSRTVVIAILRTEMVSAVLLPFKASVKTYLYGTLIVAVVLLCGPIWMLW